MRRGGCGVVWCPRRGQIWVVAYFSHRVLPSSCLSPRHPSRKRPSRIKVAQGRGGMSRVGRGVCWLRVASCWAFDVILIVPAKSLCISHSLSLWSAQRPARPSHFRKVFCKGIFPTAHACGGTSALADLACSLRVIAPVLSHLLCLGGAPSQHSGSITSELDGQACDDAFPN